jgi:hypothetical protein
MEERSAIWIATDPVREQDESIEYQQGAIAEWQGSAAEDNPDLSFNEWSNQTADVPEPQPAQQRRCLTMGL